MPFFALDEVLFLILVLSNETDDFFDDSFHEDMDELSKGDEFSDKLEDGFRNWEER